MFVQFKTQAANSVQSKNQMGLHDANRRFRHGGYLRLGGILHHRQSAAVAYFSQSGSTIDVGTGELDTSQSGAISVCCRRHQQVNRRARVTDRGVTT